MRTTTFATGVTLLLVIIGTLGCATPRRSDSAALQGSWTGREVGRETQGVCHLTITGKNLDFRGADSREWYKGTFVLHPDQSPKQLVGTISDCAEPKYVGKTVNAIYRLDEGTLTLTGNEPGDPEMPSGFEGPSARTFTLKKD